MGRKIERRTSELERGKEEKERKGIEKTGKGENREKVPIWPPAYRSATSAVDLARWPENNDCFGGGGEADGGTKCEVLFKDEEL
ncbi:hypothetical protein Baya_1119 [Bagarius yarrelli]|uniref:Uncharacterized protein n=1 Tax=Bagarius yarrelli TaxID=175774 RepID=A0A556TK67_BAGYA|nr:hypothetical protein Baya_1119 [Bagarius yarrelli]